MNFSCSQDTLARYLNTLSRIVNTKNSMPVLSNVLLKVSDGKLLMTTTDLEIGVHTWIGADVRESGEITVPVKQLSEYVSSLPVDKVDFVLKNNVLSVSSTNNTADFNTIPASEFPKVSVTTNDTPTLSLNKDDFTKAVDRVAFSASSDNSRPILTGILVEIQPDNVTFVATDSHRLSRQIIYTKTNVEDNISFVIPAKVFTELATIVSTFASDVDDMVHIFALQDNNQVLFRFNDIEMVARLLDGQFPAYKQIIPTGYQLKVEFTHEDFLNALKITNIIARNVTGNKIIVTMDGEKQEIKLS